MVLSQFRYYWYIMLILAVVGGDAACLISKKNRYKSENPQLPGRCLLINDERELKMWLNKYRFRDTLIVRGDTLKVDISG